MLPIVTVDDPVSATSVDATVKLDVRQSRHTLAERDDEIGEELRR
jgi:hypothetical protein